MKIHARVKILAGRYKGAIGAVEGLSAGGKVLVRIEGVFNGEGVNKALALTETSLEVVGNG